MSKAVNFERKLKSIGVEIEYRKKNVILLTNTDTYSIPNSVAPKNQKYFEVIYKQITKLNK